LLTKQGCDVTIAENGERALEQFAERPFDLILMDVEMPGMDGFETTRRIRKQESDGVRMPIFALTAHVLPNYGLRCLAAGMDGYLSKPLQVTELTSVIRRVANSREDSASED